MQKVKIFLTCVFLGIFVLGCHGAGTSLSQNANQSNVSNLDLDVKLVTYTAVDNNTGEKYTIGFENGATNVPTGSQIFLQFSDKIFKEIETRHKNNKIIKEGQVFIAKKDDIDARDDNNGLQEIKIFHNNNNIIDFGALGRLDANTTYYIIVTKAIIGGSNQERLNVNTLMFKTGNSSLSEDEGHVSKSN